MTEAFLAEVPFYRLLPTEQLDGEVLELCASSLLTFFRTLREGRGLDGAELAEPRASAARRAEERVPLDAVLAAYHVGGRIGWESLCRVATPAETAELVGHASGVLRFVQVVTGTVAEAYLEEQQSIMGEVRDARRLLAQALLDGEPTDAAAARAEVVLAPAYVLLALDLPGSLPGRPSTREPDAGTGARVAARRRQRRVQETLDEVVGEHVLGLFGPAGGLVLLPARRHALAELDAMMPAVVAALGRVVGAPLLAATATAERPRDVPSAGRLARDLLALAGSLGRDPGLWRLDDLLVDYQLTRWTDATPRLRSLLDPLERNPDFLPTLETWLACDLDRRGAAAALHVHPNTLDYRLRRVGELTGADPTSARGAQLLRAAVTARRLI